MVPGVWCIAGWRGTVYISLTLVVKKRSERHWIIILDYRLKFLEIVQMTAEQSYIVNMCSLSATITSVLALIFPPECPRFLLSIGCQTRTTRTWYISEARDYGQIARCQNPLCVEERYVDWVMQEQLIIRTVYIPVVLTIHVYVSYFRQ